MSALDMSYDGSLYMAVTPDEYELPLVVAASAAELARVCGTSESNIRVQICRGYNGTNSGRKFVKVEVRSCDE